MRSANFIPAAGGWRAQLEQLYDEMVAAVDKGLANKDTGHAVEAAAGAINAAAQLLSMAERGCDDKEFCP